MYKENPAETKMSSNTQPRNAQGELVYQEEYWKWIEWQEMVMQKRILSENK